MVMVLRTVISLVPCFMISRNEAVLPNGFSRTCTNGRINAMVRASMLFTDCSS